MDDQKLSCDVLAVSQTVERHFPGLWPAVDLGLSVCATLLLESNVNPTAVIYVGGPSGSETTVADMFADADTVVSDDGDEHPLVYLSDSFTPASFVSLAANRSAKELANVDLLPRIRHKVLVTPKLAPIFRGKEDDLVKTFRTITRVLDGHGFQIDGGTHGQRGYRGDYLFAWLGCTTPLEHNVWRVMGQLGSRLFFFVMADDDDREITVEMLVESDDESDYVDRLRPCKEAVQSFLVALFERHGGIRGVQWDPSKDPRGVKEWIAQAARVLAAMRSEPTREAEPDQAGHGYVPAKTEQPWRAHTILRNIARGHALVHGRDQLTEDDLPLVVRVAVGSMPSECGRVFSRFVAQGGEPLVVADVQAALRVRHRDTARKVMRELESKGIGVYIAEAPGKAALLELRHEWGWCVFGVPGSLIPGRGNLQRGGSVCRRRTCQQGGTGSVGRTCQKSWGVCITGSYHS